MSAHGITLQPIKMADLAKVTTDKPKIQGKYVPPGKRSEKEPDLVSLNSTDFPTLGLAPKATVKLYKESLLDKIKEKIRLDAIANEELYMPPETDISKMSDNDLVKIGWDIIDLVPYPPSYSDAQDSLVRTYLKYTDSGLSYDDYLYYSLSSK